MLRALAALFAVTALASCSAPAPAETSVSLLSEHGLVEADVTIVTPVARGKNQLIAQLRPHAAPGEARLLAVDATMAAHAHEAHAAAIDETEAGFVATDLDLFMTGRWLVTLELSLADEPDQVSLPVDVP